MNRVILMKKYRQPLFVPILFAICGFIVLPTSGCMVGPDFHSPRPDAPSGWAGVTQAPAAATFRGHCAACRTDTMVETVR